MKKKFSARALLFALLLASPLVAARGQAAANIEVVKYVRLLARMLTSIRQQAEAAVARGETVEQARKSVKLDEFRKLIAGDSQLRGFIFDFYVAAPGVTAAHREATAKRANARP